MDDKKREKLEALQGALTAGMIAPSKWSDIVKDLVGSSGMLGGAGYVPPTPPPMTSGSATFRPPKMSPYTDMQKLHMRMDVPQGEMLYATVAVHRCSSKVFVFIGHGDNATILEDDPVLFPSDTLIARLRLLEW